MAGDCTLAGFAPMQRYRGFGPQSGVPRELRVLSRDGRVTSLALAHGIERIIPFGDQALVFDDNRFLEAELTTVTLNPTPRIAHHASIGSDAAGAVGLVVLDEPRQLIALLAPAGDSQQIVFVLGPERRVAGVLSALSPVMIRERIFAVHGSTLIEARLDGDRVVEVARIDLRPPR